MRKAKHPEDLPMRFAEAWNARRADLLAELFEEDADFINVVGIWWENRAAIQKAHDYGLKVIFPDSTMKVGRIKVKQLSDQIAVVHASLRLTGQTPRDESAGPRHHLFMFVLRKQEDYWCCVSAQNTDIVPGAETHIRKAGGQLVPADYRL